MVVAVSRARGLGGHCKPWFCVVGADMQWRCLCCLSCGRVVPEQKGPSQAQAPPAIDNSGLLEEAPNQGTLHVVPRGLFHDVHTLVAYQTTTLARPRPVTTPQSASGQRRRHLPLIGSSWILCTDGISSGLPPSRSATMYQTLSSAAHG